MYRKMIAENLSSQEVAMYIDENKNKKQQKGETDARRLANILRHAIPDRSVVVYKRGFQVNVDHIPIVKFEPRPGDESNVRWNNKCLADLGLTTSAPRTWSVFLPHVPELAPPSGTGSNAIAPTINKSIPHFCVVTWSARALLVKDPRKRRAKFRTLDQILNASTVVFAQELHGTEEEATLALFR